jgi:hypothetical protein
MPPAATYTGTVTSPESIGSAQPLLSVAVQVQVPLNPDGTVISTVLPAESVGPALLTVTV